MTKEKEHILWIILAVVIIIAMILIAWMSNIIKLPEVSNSEKQLVVEENIESTPVINISIENETTSGEPSTNEPVVGPEGEIIPPVATNPVINPVIIDPQAQPTGVLDEQEENVGQVPDES